MSEAEFKLNTFVLIYNLAVDYNPSEADQSKKWLSRGLTDINPVYGFRGRIVPGRSLAVVGLLGLDDRRLMESIEALQPDYLSIGVGTTESTDRAWLYEKNSMVAADLAAVTNINSLFQFNCDCIDDAKTQIEKEIAQYRNSNICIIPLNNKLSAIAAGLVALENRSVQLCIGAALLYNMADYSKRSDQFQCINVDSIFGR